MDRLGAETMLDGDGIVCMRDHALTNYSFVNISCI